MADKTNKSISVNRQAMEKLEDWAKEAKKTNPSIYSPANIVSTLIVEFLKQVTKDPDLQALDDAIEQAAKAAALRKS